MISHAVRLWVEGADAPSQSLFPSHRDSSGTLLYGTAAICYTTSMIPVRAPQDVTTLLRSMFAAVTPPRCESSSPHSTSTSALPRHSPSVPALAPQPSSPTSCRCRLPHPASPRTRVYTIAPFHARLRTTRTMWLSKRPKAASRRRRAFGVYVICLLFPSPHVVG